ncbi:MAG TPA: helix-turn-helix domain-containing protein [Clostridia bacterium]|nr:helix-turn-helix domain-containing protein [Clostridia bacterium]
MLTKFGLLLRHLRLSKNQVLKDMADKIGVSSSYLSSVENGKRKVPRDWADKIKSQYDLDKTQYLELLNAVDLTNKEIIISLDCKSQEQKEVILSFARKVDDMDENFIKAFKELLKKQKGKTNNIR